MPVHWRIERTDGGSVAIAGIWEHHPVDQQLSFSMLTINADGYPLMQRFPRLYDEKRMVIILEPDQYHGWLVCSHVSKVDVYRQNHAEQLVAQPNPMQSRSRRKIPAPATPVEQGGLF